MNIRVTFVHLITRQGPGLFHRSVASLSRFRGTWTLDGNMKPLQKSKIDG
jgi:hypothetical protein